MSAGMAGSWWAIGLRSAAAILFAIVVLWLPPQAVAPLVFLFAAYLIADGAFAILAGMRAPRWGSRWPMLILEGSVNLAAAAAVLVWQSVAAVALVPIATAWAVAILGASDTRTMGLWLVGYALIFGGTLVALAGRWRRATTHLS
jgi:uncharacterized membrane protein HdeD (DUF308 family)